MNDQIGQLVSLGLAVIGAGILTYILVKIGSNHNRNDFDSAFKEKND